ncbi:MAG: hypothetical protein UHM85_01030 [Acutalibacteraceae bacterium]|nr:hypothetical protein [Acutalibacteraceae bacterium]
MSKKNKFFADDGWAMWVDGEDVSSIYLNNWLNPKGKSYMDVAIHIRGIKETTSISMYCPFPVDKNEIEDVSLKFHDENLSRAIFSSMCLIDYKKNTATSEIAYNGKTVDIVHLSALDYTVNPVSKGTLLKVPFTELIKYLDNDEAYFMFRVPHKSISEVFRQRTRVGSFFNKARDLLMSPIISESYGYSVRINEGRLLPKEINSIGSFHRQKLKKAVITISIADDYEINDMSCYRIRRLEEDLYRNFLPKDFNGENAVTYQWQQTRETNLKGHFNFYLNISRNAISKGSVALYLVIIIFLDVAGGMTWDAIQFLFNLIFG